jgi:hypothetical protein
MNPKLVAWEQLHGIFDYNATPIGPPGMRVLVHDKPQNCSTWAPHGQDAWYIGLALDHYCCYTVWMWDTCHEWETDTLTWFPQWVTMPTLIAVDIIAAGIQDIATALSDPKPNLPLNPLMTQQAAVLQYMVAIFTGVVPANDAVETPSHLRVEPLKRKGALCSYTASDYAYCAYSYNSINTYDTSNLCRHGSPQALMQECSDTAGCIGNYAFNP